MSMSLICTGPRDAVYDYNVVSMKLTQLMNFSMLW